MELLKLFTQSGTASTLIFLSLVGIAGILIGKVKVFRIKLGIAGVLFAGLFFGHLGARTDHEVLHFVKEFGLILFVYSIGLEVGPLNKTGDLEVSGKLGMRQVVFTNKSMAGKTIKQIGLSRRFPVKMLPILIIGVIARLMKLNYLSICGLLAGSMTDPPALEFANSMAPGQAQSTAYATVYPLVMFLRVLLAQILVLLFL